MCNTGNIIPSQTQIHKLFIALIILQLKVHVNMENVYMFVCLYQVKLQKMRTYTKKWSERDT